MNTDRLIGSLAGFPKLVVASVEDLSDDQLKWKPSSGNWSIQEIIFHLADEEVDDFRQRVFMTLQDPNQNWPAIDPPQWARDRKYNSGDFQAGLSRFLSERARSIDMLNELHSVNWAQSYQHPALGNLRAGDILASWCAHDQLHMRQITKRKFEMIQEDAGEFDIGYAGEWND